MKTFTKENFKNLKETCEKIIKLSEEEIDGELMSHNFNALEKELKILKKTQ